MVVFVGQVGNDFVEREAFQEIDYRRMYGPLAKWVAQIDRVERIPRVREPRLPHRVAGGPGPSCSRCRRTRCFRRRRLPMCQSYHVVRPAPSLPIWRAGRTTEKREAPFRARGRRRLDRDACALQKWARRPGCRSAPRSAARTFRQPQPELRGRRRHRHQSEARAAREGSRRAARHRRAPGRDDHQRVHAARGAGAADKRWSTCMPAPKSLAACTGSAAINSGMPQFVAALEDRS